MNKQKLIPEHDIPFMLRNPEIFEKNLRTFDGARWLRRGEDMALKLFRNVAKRVPAYKDFLKKHKIRPSSITSNKDFKNIPIVDKNNYLRKYPLDSLCWDGKFVENQWTIATTSGSTGKPFYFPHASLQDWQYAVVAEQYLRTNFEIQKKSTLYINSFPMGAWIGGVFTYEAIELIAHRGNYKLSIINPGIHKQEVIKAILSLGDYYEQVIIAGYGPFVKDILDDGKKQHVNWKKYNIKFIFSAEGFTELFRDYVSEMVGIKNLCIDTLNHYGTVDLGTMSYETPISIAVRRETLKNSLLRKDIFGDKPRLPTVTQYIPELFYFEEINESLLCSANSGFPLVRYDLKDTGNVYTYNQIDDLLVKAGTSIKQVSKENNITRTLWKLPFVQVFERKDFSVSLYAFQIYPETIRRALLSKRVLQYVTGKLSMSVIDTKRMDQKLVIHVELKQGVGKSTETSKVLQTCITEQLIEEISEYKETYREKGVRIKPKILLHTYEDSQFFKPGIKQRWVVK